MTGRTALSALYQWINQQTKDDNAAFQTGVRLFDAAVAEAAALPAALDVHRLTSAIHTADPIIGPDGTSHNPMCELRANRIAAAYRHEANLRAAYAATDPDAKEAGE